MTDFMYLFIWAVTTLGFNIAILKKTKPPVEGLDQFFATFMAFFAGMIWFVTIPSYIIYLTANYIVSYRKTSE